MCSFSLFVEINSITVQYRICLFIFLTVAVNIPVEMALDITAGMEYAYCEGFTAEVSILIEIDEIEVIIAINEMK